MAYQDSKHNLGLHSSSGDWITKYWQQYRIVHPIRTYKRKA